MKKIIKTLAAAVCGAVCLGTAAAFTSFAADYILGDVNGDGLVDASDASAILAFYADASTKDEIDYYYDYYGISRTADMNKDGYVDASDASAVLNYYSYVSTSTGDEIVDTEIYFDDEKLAEYIGFNGTDIYSNIKVTESYNASVKQVGLKWNPIEDADGYLVDFYTDQEYDENGQPFKYSRDVSTAQFTAQLNTPLGNTSAYRYRIKPYKIFAGRKVYASEGYAGGTWDHNSVTGYTVPYQNNLELLVNAADLKPHNTIYQYNIKYDNSHGGEPFCNGTLNVYQSEIDVYKEFAEEHFEAGMTNYQKIWYLADWMHENVKYATAEEYSKYVLWDGRYVTHCLVDKVGQCIQYNGALAQILSYMGYDAYMLEMYTSGQHFRCECTIDGIPFSFEVGDKGSDSPQWNYRWLWIFSEKEVKLPERPSNEEEY